MSFATQPAAFSFRPGHFDFSLAGIGDAAARRLGSPDAIRVPGLTEGQDAFVTNPLPTAPSAAPHLPPFWFRRALDGNGQDARVHAGAGHGLSDSPPVRPSAIPHDPQAMLLKVREVKGSDTFQPALYVPDHLKAYTTGEKTGTVHNAKGTVRSRDFSGIGSLSEFKAKIVALAKKHQVACRVDELFDHLEFTVFAESERDVNRFCNDLQRSVATHNASCPTIYYDYGPSLLDEMLDGLGNLWYNLFTRR